MENEVGTRVMFGIHEIDRGMKRKYNLQKGLINCYMDPFYQPPASDWPSAPISAKCNEVLGFRAAAVIRTPLAEVAPETLNPEP